MAAKEQVRPVLKKRVSTLKIPVSPVTSEKQKPQFSKTSVSASKNGETIRNFGKKNLASSPNSAPKPITGITKQVSYNKDVETKFDEILEGQFTDLLPLPRSTVRIFLSSTFSDMRAERNALAKEAYPKLRDYCTEKGLGFQVVDLRWGVTAEATNNHLTTKICLLELENCQKVSVGPSCIAIIGNRYGFCPLPYEISIEEYTVLKSEAEELGLDGFDLIDQWYFKDDNSLPAAYYLQPITSSLPYFLDNSSEFTSQRQSQIEEWNSIEKQMLATIYKAAESACAKSKISVDRKHFYLMSVTEHEARAGIITAGDHNNHGLAFIRELEGFTSDNYRDNNASRYKDLINCNDGPEADTHAENMLLSFKKELHSCLIASNIMTYSIPWRDGGVKPEKVPAHKDYMSQFCSDFVTRVSAMIEADELAKESLIREGEYYSYFEEILHHAHFCKKKSETFCGQIETLSRIKEYILDATNRKPFVIHAESGAGKTSVMAMAMNSLKLWIKEDYIGIIRFLGTSPLSTDIYSVLFSVCGQLADITDSIMEPQSYRSMKALAMYIPRFFRTIGTIVRKPVIIFLDSLDQLESKHDAYTAWWLPVNLPANFKLIISTLPDHHGILSHIKALVGQDKNFVEVPLLPDTTSREIVAKYLTLKRRKVTDNQMDFLLESFRKSPSPLFLKLLMDQAVHWCSYTPMSNITLPDYVRVAINNLFQQLEVKFGSKFVQGALGLLTVGFNGLSEIELEDGLSCMDDVMNEIYKFHDPPVPGIIRVPPVMWARLRYDINEYLVERQSQGQATLFWYHRQFREVAAERYANGTMRQNLHKVLFELFAAENGVKKDIVLIDRENLRIINADRNTTPQVTSCDNARKLECLFYHLKNSVKVQDQDFVKETTYCNLMFLRAKVAAAGVDKLLREIEEYQSLVQDPEIEVIIKFIISCSSSLKDPVAISFNILAHIPDDSRYKNLATLKTMAKKYLSDLSRIAMAPSFACLVPRCGEPEKVYVGFSHFLGIRNELVLFASSWPCGSAEQSFIFTDHSTSLACIDMKTGELSKHFCEDISCEPYISANGKDLIYFSVAESAIIKLHIESGKCVKFLVNEVCPGLQGNRMASYLYNITGSDDSKYLVFSFGDSLVIVDSANLKPTCMLQHPVKAKVTNVHCCSGPPVAVIMTSVDGEIVFWDVGKKEVKRQIKTECRIETKCSQMTLGDEYHICFGKLDKENVIYVNKIKHEETSDPIRVSNSIQSMKVSRVDLEVYFLIGGTEIKVLNTDTKQFIKTLKHDVQIVSFDVAWDEDKLVLSDVNNSIVLFNRNNFDLLISHNGILGQINFVCVLQGQMLVSTLEDKVKIWNMKEFFSAHLGHNKTEMKISEKSLSSQEDVTCFAISLDSQSLLTAGTCESCQVWSLLDYSFIREFRIHMKPAKMVCTMDDTFVAYDSDSKRLVSFKLDGLSFNSNYPEHITCFAITKLKDKLIFLTKSAKQTLFIYDLKVNVYLKKFNVHISFQYLSAQMFLSVSERYAVLQLEITSGDFKAISAMWNKGTKLPEQKHPYRFSAVDLNQGSGVPMHVFHQLSKVPQLGVTVEPYKGNMMMISCRRWVVFWDIPTGNCDQMRCKAPRKPKMYRPDWLGQDCVGTNDVISMSYNKEYVAVGSQDGYVFVYGGESGMPAGMKAPTTRHPSPVNQVCFNYSSTLVASSCTSGYLKLWIPKTGQCMFSVCIGMELKQLEFSPDGKKLLAITTGEISHILVLDILKP